MKKQRTVLLLVIFQLSMGVSYAMAEQTLQTQQVANIASPYKGVIELNVKLGQQVKKGQLLFELNQDILKAQKKYYKSSLTLYKDILAGAKKLVKTHAIPLDLFQQSVRDSLMSKSSYKLILNTIRTSKYYAPFDGTVTKIVRYDGSGLGDNDDEIEVSKGFVKVDTANRVAMVCNRWSGIVDLKVGLSQKVKKGQPLFSIDKKEFEIQKEKHESFLKYSKLLYDRRLMLSKTKSVSLYKMGLAENKYEEAVMNVKIDEIKIRQCTFYAPFDGTVTKVYRYSGSGNGKGKPVVDITALN